MPLSAVTWRSAPQHMSVCLTLDCHGAHRTKRIKHFRKKAHLLLALNDTIARLGRTKPSMKFRTLVACLALVASAPTAFAALATCGSGTTAMSSGGTELFGNAFS